MAVALDAVLHFADFRIQKVMPRVRRLETQIELRGPEYRCYTHLTL